MTEVVLRGRLRRKLVLERGRHHCCRLVLDHTDDLPWWSSANKSVAVASQRSE